VPLDHAGLHPGPKLAERRQFFTTADTVADLDELRRALGVGKLSFDGSRSRHCLLTGP
jgi:hypothetical protein